MSISNSKSKLELLKTHSSRFGWKIIYDWSFSLSALVAYNLLVSLLPLILCLFSVTSLIYSQDADIVDSVRNRLVKAFPEEGLANATDALLQSLSHQAGIVFLVTFLISIFTGSRLLIALDDILTIIYRLRERKILDQNIHAIKMVLIFIIFMPLIIITSSASAIFDKSEGVYQFVTSLFSTILGFFLFQLIYMYVPRRQMHWHNTWCGSLVGAIGLRILILIFPLYANYFMSSYVGQMGFVIITVLFFYVIGLIFVMGAQINAYFFDNIQPLSSGLGNYISESIVSENVQLIDDNLQANNSMTTLKEGFDPIH